MGNEETRKRVVVDGRHDGNVIPADVSEWHREVFLRPGARVNGCVFGDSVTLTGPDVVVRKSVVALTELTIEVGGVWIQSSMSSEDVVVTRRCQKEVRVSADVFGRKITLHNCVVMGSVVGEEVRLLDCVVLGRVQGSKLVNLKRSLVQIVDAGTLTFQEGCSLISAYARSRERPVLEAPVSLAFSGADTDVLREEDIVRTGGFYHLQAGKRLTNLEERRRRIEVLRNFLVVQLFGENLMPGEGSRLEVSAEDLHPALRRSFVR